MLHYNYIIIGGGAAGVSAAETIRQNDKEGTIAIVSDEPHPLYSRVMLSKPNFFLGKIPFEQIYLKGADWYEKNEIDFLGGKTATDIDLGAKQLIISSADNIILPSDSIKLSYDKLLIATGVKARTWQVKGADKKGIHYLRNLEDGKGIMEAIKNAKRAVVIGGGFISFEMADLMKMAGLETTLIIRESYFWEPMLDRESGEMIEKAMTKSGVVIKRNAEVAEVIGNKQIDEGISTNGNNEKESVAGVILTDGTKIPCDIIICGIGVLNPVDWLKKSGITTNCGVIADEFLHTNVPDVWVAGDIAEYNDLLLEEHVQMGNWVNAHEQGRIAGLNMSGKSEPFKFVSFYTTAGFGLSIAFVGDVTPASGRTVIKRGSPESNSYARIIIDHDEIEGATLINHTNEMSAISKLIEGNIKVSDKIEKLQDVNFDLKDL